VGKGVGTGEIVGSADKVGAGMGSIVGFRVVGIDVGTFVG